jgi:hypothetical protein
MAIFLLLFLLVLGLAVLLGHTTDTHDSDYTMGPLLRPRG